MVFTQYCKFYGSQSPVKCQRYIFILTFIVNIPCSFCIVIKTNNYERDFSWTYSTAFSETSTFSNHNYLSIMKLKSLFKNYGYHADGACSVVFPSNGEQPSLITETCRKIMSLCAPRNLSTDKVNRKYWTMKHHEEHPGLERMSNFRTSSIQNITPSSPLLSPKISLLPGTVTNDEIPAPPFII